jgi:hypothetical protein
MKPTIALRYSMQETIENWFASNSLEIKNIAIVKDWDGNFDYAVGEFFPVLFDKESDGPKLKVLYQLEIALIDERFDNTDLFFETGLKFSIQ